MKRLLVLLLAGASLVAAASIDGKWKADIAPAARKKVPTKAPLKPTAMTLDLRADGDRLTGNVITAGAKHDRSTPIADGKISGSHFSFTTTGARKKGSNQKLSWEGTIEGDQITGTRMRDGAKRPQKFVAKRAQ